VKQILSIVGKSDNGKTTLIEKLVKELKNRGYSVATIKHSVNGFLIDKKGKDSYRHKKAGADAIIISSPKKVAFIKEIEEELSIDQLVQDYLSDMDIVLAEGYKRERKPKIEIFRKEAGHQDLLCKDDEDLIALVTNNRHLCSSVVPNFDLDDVIGLTNFIEKKYLK